MVEICLSVAPILRCQTLSRLESGALLIPPGLEILFAVVLLWVKRASDKKDVFIASEVFIYFLLALFDVLSHTIPFFATTLNSFKALDIVIGVGSLVPLLLYTLALYLIAMTDFIPSLPTRFQNIAKYVLLVFIPLIALLNELSSFVGITYRSFGGTNGQPVVLGVGFTSNVARIFLNSVTLVLVTTFQALNFCVAFYHLFRALSHQRSLEQNPNEKDIETHLFRGLGWIVAGTKLGAIETVIGFAQAGFAIALTRRLLRLLSRACLIIGLVKGGDTVEDFQIYRPSETQKRRKSMLRAMIQNPRFSTFRHVGGHDFDKPNPFDEKRESVIRVGDPSWMRRDHRPGHIDEERASPGLLTTTKRKSTVTFLTTRPSVSRLRKSPSLSSVSSPGSMRRNPWTYSESPMDEFQDNQEDVMEVDRVSELPRVPRAPRPLHQRVTVHIRQDRLPVLELRRFSNLDFVELMQDPFRDPHTRSLSLPMPDRPADRPVVPLSAPLTRLRAYSDAPSPQTTVAPAPPLPAFPAPVVRYPSAHESVSSRYSRASFSSYDRRSRSMSAAAPRAPAPLPLTGRSSAVTFGPRDSLILTTVRQQRASASSSSLRGSASRPPSFRVVGSPSATIASWETPGSSMAPRFAAGAGAGSRSSRVERGLSSSTTVSEVHALALQFPGIPSSSRGLTAVPPRRSMLSHELARRESGSDVSDHEQQQQQQQPQQAEEPEQQVERVPSVKRKPSPLMTEGLVDERMQHVEIEQVVDEVVLAPTAMALPTPLSAPRRFLTARQRLRERSSVDVPVPATLTPTSDDGGEYAREAEVVRSQSLVRRSVGTERPKLVRVKSMGSAPRREVAAARRMAFARDSLRVELGHIAKEGKLAGVVGVQQQQRQGSDEAVITAEAEDGVVVGNVERDL